MPIQIIREDITKLTCDAIVNAANNTLLGGGGVDGAIHRAAGKGLLLECKSLGGCETGKAKITGGYNLPCKYVIHTVGPVWHSGKYQEKELLESCYRESLELAKKHECESVAFPLISSGVYGYPKDQALRVAIDVISTFLLENEMLVYVVIFDKAAYQIGEKLFADIKAYIDDHYVDLHTDYSRVILQRAEAAQMMWSPQAQPLMPHSVKQSAMQPTMVTEELCEAKVNLDDGIIMLDESFTEMLLRKIDEKDMTDAECYKKANVDRKLFSKIRNNVHYSPSKTTAIAFAIALEMDLGETKEFLEKAGYALSHSNKFDVIIEYFIQNRNYNVFEINEALFAFDQNLLGC